MKEIQLPVDHKGYDLPIEMQVYSGGVESPIQVAIRNWQIVFGQVCPNTPTLGISNEQKLLAVNMIGEEFCEFSQAIANGDLIELADAAGDLLWVVIAYAFNSFGLDVNLLLAEIYRSNVTKITEDGKILRREGDGKILKPDTFRPPDIARILVAMEERFGRRESSRQEGTGSKESPERSEV